jgi:hypothetical protein
MAAAITMFKNGHFAFAAPEKTAYIFLVRKNYHECYRNGKNTVHIILHIENDQNKNRECHAGQYGTQGNETG